MAEWEQICCKLSFFIFLWISLAIVRLIVGRLGNFMGLEVSEVLCRPLGYRGEIRV